MHLKSAALATSRVIWVLLVAVATASSLHAPICNHKFASTIESYGKCGLDDKASATAGCSCFRDLVAKAFAIKDQETAAAALSCLAADRSVNATAAARRCTASQLSLLVADAKSRGSTLRAQSVMARMMGKHPDAATVAYAGNLSNWGHLLEGAKANGGLPEAASVEEKRMRAMMHPAHCDAPALVVAQHAYSNCTHNSPHEPVALCGCVLQFQEQLHGLPARNCPDALEAKAQLQATRTSLGPACDPKAMAAKATKREAEARSAAPGRLPSLRAFHQALRSASAAGGVETELERRELTQRWADEQVRTAQRALRRGRRELRRAQAEAAGRKAFTAGFHEKLQLAFVAAATSTVFYYSKYAALRQRFRHGAAGRAGGAGAGAGAGVGTGAAAAAGSPVEKAVALAPMEVK